MTRKRPPKDLPHSIRERLANHARQTGRPFQEVLTYYALERFLYRLGTSPHGDRFILKGALLFRSWDAPPARPTRDADFLGRGDSSVDALVGMVREIVETSVGPDGLRFDPHSVAGEPIREEQEYGGVRIRLVGYLEQARVTMQLDIGFGDVIVPGPQPVVYPTLLPDSPPPRLHGYTRESVVAEKFEAMVSLGEINTRYKDFYDLWFLARTFDFEGTLLAGAIEATFARRGTALTATPVAWTDAFGRARGRQAQWQAFLRRTGVADAPGELAETVGLIRDFVGPVVTAFMAGDEPPQVWRAPGPWQLSEDAELRRGMPQGR